MIEFAGRKVTANELAKLKIIDTINCMYFDGFGEVYDNYTDKELQAIEKAHYAKVNSVKVALGIEKLCKKLDLWQG